MTNGPQDIERRNQLVQLYEAGLKYREIADIYGGTPQGVRGNIRRLRDIGVTGDRRRVGQRWELVR